MIKLIRGDITKIKVDAIVNAANTSLLGGGGVDGAIHRAGGKTILEQCIKIREKQGAAKLGGRADRAGELPAKYVIHTVGLFGAAGIKAKTGFCRMPTGTACNLRQRTK